MRVGTCRSAAAGWVAAHAATTPGFCGAFFSGSTTDLPDDNLLPTTSDVDVSVVLSGSAVPPKPGKFAHDGILLEVSYLPWTTLADIAEVASTYYLAPSFSSDQVIADPTGRLGQLRAEIAPLFRSPASIASRYEDVIRRLTARLSALDPHLAWHDQVTAWMFPTSLTTQISLVAALRTPTVRRRYAAARAVLHEHGQHALYASQIELLGCAGCDRPTVQRHLDELAAVFDRAAAVARTPFAFSGDITAAARPIAIGGSQELVDGGDHHEAVFWIIATYARCLQILAADAPDLLLQGAEQGFRAAAADLLGVRTPADLASRRERLLELLPRLRESAASIADGAA